MIESQDKDHASLFNALEAKGWVWENERLYAPNKTFWIEGTMRQRPTSGMLIGTHERIKVTVENLKIDKPAHLNGKQYEDWVSDMESLVKTLEELIEENQNIQ